MVSLSNEVGETVLERLSELMLSHATGSKDELERLHLALLEAVVAEITSGDRETASVLHERIRKVYDRVALEHPDTLEVNPIFNLGRLAGVLEILGLMTEYSNPAELKKLLKEEGGKEILAGLQVDEARSFSEILAMSTDHVALPRLLGRLEASGVILLRRLPKGVVVILTPLGKQTLEELDRVG
jgi:hypothetical protein